MWSLLIEKAFIAFMGGECYDDICEGSDFSTATTKGVTAHASSVIQVFARIMDPNPNPNPNRDLGVHRDHG